MSTTTEAAPSDQETVEQPSLNLDSEIKSPAACVREVVVTIPAAEVARYRKKQYDEIVPDAQLPGFRSGRAPRQLVEKQFKDRVDEQVKNELLMDSLSHFGETDQFTAIGEPDFDYNAISVPDDGEFKFQFTIEVRPDFDTPDWKGMKLTKPVEDVADPDLDAALKRVLARYSSWEATDEAAERGDRLVVNVTFKHDGKTLSMLEEETVTLADELSFADGTIANFGELMIGVVEGDRKTGTAKISSGATNEALRDQDVEVEIEVIEVQKSEPPELTEDFLQELGDFESEDELRRFIEDSLRRQADYRTDQAVRAAVVSLLLESADFELPSKLVKSQTRRELNRRVLELRRNGFDDDVIRNFVNQIQQNSEETTKTSLREHFILEQIAEDEDVEANDDDFDHEIALIAEQQDESPRRVRARLEKSGEMDALRNQIVERKVIQLIVENADVTEEKKPLETSDNLGTFAVNHRMAPGGDDGSIPEAKYDNDQTPAGQTS